MKKEELRTKNWAFQDAEIYIVDFCLRLFFWGFNCYCSVAKSCPTFCDPRGRQHAMLPYALPSPTVCSISCSLSWWCHPTISSSVALFSCPQYFPASGSFLVSQLFLADGQSIGASSSVLPKNIQGWFPLVLTDLISLLSKELWRVFSSTTKLKHQFFSAQPSVWSNSQIHS